MSKPYPARLVSPRRSGSGLSPNDYEEFASLQLDRPGEGELKSAEEMKRHLFDDHFEGRPIERAMHILATGEEVQRLSVIRDLLQLIHSDEQGCLQRVIQKIQQVLNNASTEFHIETARAFGLILQKKAVSYTTFANSFLPSVTYHLDNRDSVVSSAWLETLLLATDLLPVEVVRNNIVTVAINKGQISQNVRQRTASCKILGKLCLRLDAQSVKKDILPVVLSLCQDVNETVRACICGQLYFVAKGIPSDSVRTSLIPILVELGRDETVQVRVEATEAIVNLIPLLSHDVLKSTIIPLIKKICEQAVIAVDDTLVMVAKQFGGLSLGLEGVLTPTERIWMVTYYHNLSHMGISTYGPKRDVFYNVNGTDRVNARYGTLIMVRDCNTEICPNLIKFIGKFLPANLSIFNTGIAISSYGVCRVYEEYIECRHFCAYNFPAMAKFCSSSPELLEKVYPSFCDFSTDPYYLVRKTIGAGLHEVARILGSNNRVVKNQVLTLLLDNMEEVLLGVVSHLGRTIDYLVSSGVLGNDQDGVSFDLGRGLLRCDKTIRDKTHNWRLYADFITQLESIVKCLPSDYIYSHFVPLMFEKMHRARPLPCRLAAARTLLIFLRYNLKPNQRQEIRSRLQSEFCLSSSCYKRMLYLRLCNTAREVFSRAYFKEHFFYPLLSRSEDKVANNRLILIRQFPSLKAMIVMPTEKKHLQTLETCVRSMVVSEKDRDVAAELRILIRKFDKTETLTDPPTVQTSEDVEDRKKYEEEVRVANTVARPGAVMQIGPLDNRRNREVRAQALKTNETRMNTSSMVTPSSHIVPSTSPRGYATPSNQSVASSYTTLPHRDTYSAQSFQGFTNTTNNMPVIRSTVAITHNSNIDETCSCLSTTKFRSEYLRNLNLLALLDTNLVNSKQKLSESLRQKLNEDPRFKMTRSSKHNMEMSWLNLETDLQNELLSLVKSRQIRGDRNFKEKSKFLSDFRHYNEPNLSKFINEERDYKETIYNVTGVGIPSFCERPNPNLFEARINFFEKKIKSEDPKYNSYGLSDRSCSEVGVNRMKTFESDESKKFSYFSKNFEEDFYRDAGVKANEVIGRKLSGIPVYDKPTSAVVPPPKMSTSFANKRRTWFGNENANHGTVKLETITGVRSKSFERKKSETLPAKESVSLKKLGIGPRSKSFVLPSTLMYSDKQVSACQSTKLILNKENKALKLDDNTGNILNQLNSQPDTNGNKFGFRKKSREVGQKVEGKVEKPLLKTKIPVGRVGNGSSPVGSRSSSPSLAKEKPETGLKTQVNGTKKIPVVVSRKSMLIQSTTMKNEVKNNRRSLDSSKISLANLDKPQVLRRKPDKVTTAGKGKSGETGALTNGSSGIVSEEKGEGEAGSCVNSSKLPIRRPKTDK